MSYLALYFPCLQLDSICFTRTEADAESTQEPASIVLDAQQCVCQLNARAHARHIQPGMKLGSAAALAQPLTILHYDSDFERRRLHEIAEACYAVSAEISVCGVKALICQVEPMLRLHGSLPAYIEALEQVLAAQSVCVSAGLAETPEAALLLAKHFSTQMPVEGFGKVWLSGEERREALSALCVRELAIPERQQQQLARLGLGRLGDVLKLMEKTGGRNELSARLGYDLLQYLDQIEGRVPQPLAFFEPRQSFSGSILFDHELQNSQSLLFPLKNLLQRLEHFLLARACFVTQLRVYLVARDQSEQLIDLASAGPERQAQGWLTLAQLKLESFQLTAPLVAVRLEASTFVEADTRTADLFTSPSVLSPVQLLSRLQSKLGEPAVQAMHLQASYVPESSFLFAPVGKAGAQAKSENFKECKHFHTFRPSLLLDVPVPLSEDVRIVHGPERIQSAWWSDEALCRDYFVARNTRQQSLWIFRDEHQDWFVHGLFA